MFIGFFQVHGFGLMFTWRAVWLLSSVRWRIKQSIFYLKGALCSYGKPIQTQHFNISNSNEVIIQEIFI